MKEQPKGERIKNEVVFLIKLSQSSITMIKVLSMQESGSDHLRTSTFCGFNRSTGSNLGSLWVSVKKWSVTLKVDALLSSQRLLFFLFPTVTWMCRVASSLPYIGVMLVCWVCKNTREDSAHTRFTWTSLSIIKNNNGSSNIKAAQRSLWDGRNACVCVGVLSTCVCNM